MNITTEPETIVHAVGLCYASVCTNDSVEGATATLNRLQPTGLESPWSPSEANFIGAESNTVPCNKNPDTHRHVLFNC